MGREVRRVSLDFEWPTGKVWDGYLLPESLHEDSCPDCETGYSKRGEYLHALWYGNVPFRPEDNGSTPFPATHPVVRAFAERNVSSAPQYYGLGFGPDLAGRGDAVVQMHQPEQATIYQFLEELCGHHVTVTLTKQVNDGPTRPSRKVTLAHTGVLHKRRGGAIVLLRHASDPVDSITTVLPYEVDALVDHGQARNA